MTSPKLIVVLGATGNQGSSVINTYLSEGQSQWKIRGVSRNTSSDKAQALTARGVEMVKGDLNSKSSLNAAFAGAHAIFIVSDYWGTFGSLASTSSNPNDPSLYFRTAELEQQQLTNAFDAAAQLPTLERLVVSSLANASKWSNGKYTHVCHFEYKARACEEAAKRHPELWAKTSVFQPGWFLSNYLGGPFVPSRSDDGVVRFYSQLRADAKLPFIAGEEDTGPLVQALLGALSAGKHLIGYREYITMPEMVAAWSEVTGQKAEYVALPEDADLPLPEGLKPIMSDQYGFFNEFGYEAGNDSSVIHPKQLEDLPKLGSVAQYFKTKNWDFLTKAA